MIHRFVGGPYDGTVVEFGKLRPVRMDMYIACVRNASNRREIGRLLSKHVSSPEDPVSVDDRILKNAEWLIACYELQDDPEEGLQYRYVGWSIHGKSPRERLGGDPY